MLGACVCSRTKDQDEPKRPGAPTPTEAEAPSVAYAAAFQLDRARAAADMAVLTESPHPFGSPRQAQIIAWLEQRLAEGGSRVVRDAFTADTPNPAVTEDTAGPMSPTIELSGANVVALDHVKADPPCVVALGSHIDTKIVPGVEYVGANDSGSSTVAVLQLVQALKARPPEPRPACDVVAVFFDGEEAVLFEWNEGQFRHPARIQDNTYGSRSLAGRLTACEYEGRPAKCLPASLGGKPLVGLVLLDMIGAPGIRISRDQLSTASLVALAARGARLLGMETVYDIEARAIQDDHVPFLEAGVAAVDLIDFNHLDHWHADGDVAANISYDSIELGARLGLFVALEIARAPAEYLR